MRVTLSCVKHGFLGILRVLRRVADDILLKNPLSVLLQVSPSRTALAAVTPSRADTASQGPLTPAGSVATASARSLMTAANPGLCMQEWDSNMAPTRNALESELDLRQRTLPTRFHIHLSQYYHCARSLRRLGELEQYMRELAEPTSALRQEHEDLAAAVEALRAEKLRLEQEVPRIAGGVQCCFGWL